MKYRHLLASVITMLAAPAFATAPISGKWLTTERDSIIEIGHCDDARGGSLCGKVAHVFKMGDDGKAMLDFHNPATELRTRSIQGINVLTELADSGSDWRGKIYDPKSGKSYKSIVTRNPDGTLLVQGCVSFICKSFVWTPAR
ncbi:DUF2147 domain-containing protein [Sphingomonas paeninsulae]|uniref:DUF2147 domain-containing protein n=1 Tax=Sphingomonas paeninsulae TaxID=2319844 RepID=A0A494TN07_SPHPE|nr:DUF2147 domain-containing protein [Sphingomonas paeninsulae]AYJ86485.1 DUF2147 domain-containing protein [Sphingomonas paeninsulae]